MKTQMIALALAVSSSFALASTADAGPKVDVFKFRYSQQELTTQGAQHKMERRLARQAARFCRAYAGPRPLPVRSAERHCRRDVIDAVQTEMMDRIASQE